MGASTIDLKLFLPYLCTTFDCVLSIHFIQNDDDNDDDDELDAGALKRHSNFRDSEARPMRLSRIPTLLLPVLH